MNSLPSRCLLAGSLASREAKLKENQNGQNLAKLFGQIFFKVKTQWFGDLMIRLMSSTKRVGLKKDNICRLAMMLSKKMNVANVSLTRLLSRPEFGR